MFNWFKKEETAGLFRTFIRSRKIGKGRRRLYERVGQILSDYEALSGKHFSSMSAEDLDNLYRMVVNGKSRNYACCIFKALRTFFSWCEKKGTVRKSPFADYRIPAELYGSPVYLSKDDICRIMDTDLSAYPSLEVQRDIFIFQCNVGCRVSDMMRLKKSDVIKGVLEYIPQKTIRTQGTTVKVPLNMNARSIVSRYSGTEGDSLLPFISSRNYNVAIKRILTLAGVDYLVTRLDSVSGKEIKVNINSIASSHLARRTFVGNIYRCVKDPSLVSSMTGHSEGSRAFRRYREIDMDMKREMVGLLDI